jgi:hypothetical protein
MTLLKPKPKDPAAVALNSKRNAKLSPERRREIAQIAARARWARKKKKSG